MKILRTYGLTTGIPVKESCEVSAEIPRHSGMQISSQGGLVVFVYRNKKVIVSRQPLA